MSRKPDEDEEGVDLSELSEALGQGGQLVPETRSEVRIAEDSIEESSVDLPDSLSEYTPRKERSEQAPATPQAAEKTTRPKMGIVIPFFSAGAGFAVAAAVLFALLKPEAAVDGPKIAGTPDELRPDEPQPLQKLTVTIENECDGCCGGNSCTEKEHDLMECASGRLCVPCNSDDQQNAYKLRLSALQVDPGTSSAWAAADTLRLSDLQLCALAGDRPLGCRSAAEGPSDLLNWLSLPTASTRNQLVGGVELRLVSQQKGTLAEWKNSVLMSPETLCRGVAATLRDPKTGASFGRASLFFDDAYFVELFRAGTAKELTERRAKISGSTELIRLYQTKAPGENAFALVVGPLSRKPAENVRWQLLDQGIQARINFGEDLDGRPRPRD